MRAWAWSVLVILIFLVFGLVLVFDSDEPHMGLVQAVELEVEEGAVEFEDQTVHAGEKITADPNGITTNQTANPEPEATPAQALVTAATEPTTLQTLISDALEVRVVDALGDLISDATLEIAGTIYDASSGRISIEDLSEGTQVVTAHAEGYTSSSKTIDIPARETVDIELEYTCSFVITVLDNPEEGKPVAGAEVKLWEGPEVPRPVGRTLTIKIHNNFWDNWDGAIVLRRKGGKIQVTDSLGSVDSRFMDRSLKDTLTVTGLTNDFHLVQIPSLLRLWDSLAVLCLPGEDSAEKLKMIFEKADRTFTESFCIAEKEKGKLLSTVVTNANGECAFRDLPARLYYVTVESGDMTSFVHPLCPAFSELEIPLFPEDENEIVVRAINEDSTFWRERSISDIEVRAQAIGRMIMVAGKPHERGGVSVKPLPRGEYKVSVTPPEKANVVPTQKTVEVCIEEPITRVVVPFNMKDRYKVTGKVIRADTKQPVAGHPLQLSCDLNRMTREETRKQKESWSQRGRTYTKKFAKYAVTETDQNGEFEFYPVDNGEYLIENVLLPEKFDGFIPAPPQNQTPDKDPHFWLEDADVTGIEFYVIPGVMTHFEGKVISADGEPVDLANVTLNASGGSARASTYMGGHFEMDLFTPVSDESGTGVFEVIKKYHGLETKTVTKNKQQLKGTIYGPEGEIHGSLSIEYEPGSAVENVVIVLQPETSGPMLSGVIKTKDGSVPEFVEFFKMQANQKLPDRKSSNARILEDGSYNIDLKNFQPGPFMVQVFCSQPKPVIEGTERLNTFSPDQYFYQKAEFTLLENTETLHHDFVLEEAGYFYGKIVDQDYKPVAKASVIVYDTAAPSYNEANMFGYRSTCKTDVNGMFLLDGIRRDLKYKLKVSGPSGSGTSSVELDNLEPPSDNIVIQVNLEKTAQ